MAAFNFQKFTDSTSSFDAKVSIRQTGQFGFNAGAVNKYGLSDVDFVVLYFDAVRRAIGIDLQKEQCEGALELNKTPSNFHVRAKNFCDKFGIDYGRAARFPLRKDSESGFLVFELGEGKPEEADATSQNLKQPG